MARGRFVTLEGPEGAGKSTQLKLLVEWLQGQGIEPVVTREPGGTALGDRIRDALFGSHADGMLPLTEAFLMNAARAQHVHELLRPALTAGKLVLCDRYADATLAYQGYGHGLDLTVLRQLIASATGGLQPDVSIYLDVAAKVGLERKRVAYGEGGELNRIDRMDLAFHERVVAGYRALIAAEPDRWRVVDASRPAEQVQTELRALFQAMLPG
jgi:dTMP kinase